MDIKEEMDNTYLKLECKTMTRVTQL